MGPEGTSQLPVAAASLPGSGPALLLVDDSEENQALMARMLRAGAYRVAFADNGQVAFDRIQADRYDLILMDLQMPVLDGLEATRRIRAWELDHGLAPTPILALTGSAGHDDVQRCLEAGFTGHLTKPVRRAKLLESLIQHLGAGAAGPVAAPAEPSVEVPAEIAELIPRFLANRARELGELRAWLEARDWERIRALGHAIKGTAGGYHFTELAELARELEGAAGAGQGDRVSDCLDRIGAHLEAVRVVVVD